VQPFVLHRVRWALAVRRRWRRIAVDRPAADVTVLVLGFITLLLSALHGSCTNTRNRSAVSWFSSGRPRERIGLDRRAALRTPTILTYRGPPRQTCPPRNPHGTFRKRRYQRSVHLLLVEDDPRLGRLLTRLFREDRHVVELAGTGRDGLDVADSGTALDAIVLDIGLPDVDGLEVARRLRARGRTTPIIMLTARDALNDRVAGLDAGADDYLTKPFAYEELAARLRALGRRASTTARANGATLTSGPIVLDEARRLVTVEGQPVELTPREFALLECLLRHPGHALSRDQLIDQAWPLGVAVTPNTVDAFVTFLRRKLGPAGAARIETVRGIGYRLSA
jgi:two-component system OmpR family response regulator